MEDQKSQIVNRCTEIKMNSDFVNCLDLNSVVLCEISTTSVILFLERNTEVTENLKEPQRLFF